MRLKGVFLPKFLRFTATWCGPCRVAGPVIEKVASERGVQIEVIDIDSDPDTADRYNVMAVPTLLAVDDDGVELSRLVGLQLEPTYRDWMQRHLTA